MEGIIGNFFSLFTTGPAYDILRIVGKLWFVWLPLMLVFIFWDVWIVYVRTRWMEGNSWVLLEIKPPREIAKSPRAMELVFNSLHSYRKGNLIEQFWNGFVSMWYSLEIAGINGDVHFFVRTTTFSRNLIESQLYAQYPDIEITEVDDYTKAIPKELPNDTWKIWGTEFKLTKPDAYPIKTYVDFKLDDGLEEEEKTDPLSSLIEFLGSLKPGEQIWFQILIRGAGNDWQAEGEKLIEKLLGRKKFDMQTKGEVFMPVPSPGESDVLKAIERSISKTGYKTGMRLVYVAKKDVYTPASFSAFLGILKQFNSLQLNGLAPTNSTSIDYFFPEWRSIKRQKRLVRMFRSRSYFYPPYGSFLRENAGRVPPFILNTEELATIFHLPGYTAETPTFQRLEARKGEPPPNLPI
ncbi:MAG: hypothetical protein COU47_03615 [Candidatus Niyogibacteria bacterium CG10_big_fil_rev_8_21_14_0_10_46_36]|uniref:DUF8128 domain-containing protein n=1 Tax=Candidatus Niyogibacteria bacterium CG10_big_fil_rev_8_21_14_0_10_46_36 TaxID=1974726 RepID=A0A2H0TCZ2_9BACT|nr:MAG: hypothetical protein COU47_03615 [Candidatus Niyogibacteria bacterium CG10_big_fil_rev_8_21_14_0_10_46_36]